MAQKTPAEPRWISTRTIATDPALTDNDKIRLLAALITETGIAMGLAMIHGPSRGYRKYVETGGYCRLTDDDMLIRTDAIERAI